MPGIAQVDAPVPGEREPVATIARRQHAIEHVDAARDRFDEIVGVPTPIR